MTAMTPDETANLALFADRLAAMGEPPSSIGFAMTRRLDEMAEMIAPVDPPETLLEALGAALRPDFLMEKL